MRAVLPVLLMSVVATALVANSSIQARLSAARQLIVVTTKDWDAVGGELRRYERASARAPWREVGEPIPVVVGRTGLAWGRGLHGDASPIGGAGPVKKEGDGKSPAGAFSLGAAFGYAETASGVKLPYVQAVPTLECVDDVKSAHYNRVLDRRSVARPDWDSSEEMQRKDDLYRLGVIVNHNETRVAGCGSCIFLHIWSGPGKGTAGCTAMEAARLTAVAQWLDPKKEPLLVQLPQAEYRQLQRPWTLPAGGQ